MRKKNKFIYCFILFNFYLTISYAQWNKNGNSIYYALGKVGIGVSDPLFDFELKSHQFGSENILKIDVSDSDDYFKISNVTGNNETFIPYLQSVRKESNDIVMMIGGDISEELDFGTAPLIVFDARKSGKEVENRPLFDWRNYGVSMMLLDSKGNLGISTTIPSSKLDVSGALTVNDRRGDVEDGKLINIASTNKSEISFSFYFGGNRFMTPFLGLKASSQDSYSLVVDANGNVGIGTTEMGSYKLAVDGKIGARELKITKNSWADYVFSDSYNLLSLEELEVFIYENKHLPNFPSEKDISVDGGYNLGDMYVKLLEKVEELTLYSIKLNKEIKELKTTPPSKNNLPVEDVE